jgi:hypothetical protein
MSSVVDYSADPFKVLDLDPTEDKKEIKGAYKRMALKYHPDVITNQGTSVEERKIANESFAKINWAYAQLSGRHGDNNSSSSSSRSSTSSTSTTSASTSSSSHTPPHPRTSSSSSSYFYAYNPDQPIWADIMPKDNQQYQTYNAGGNSFDKKLEDLFNGAAEGVAGGGDGDMFRDCVEFLENTVNGYSGEECDAELYILLTTGSVEQVGMKMDDTELVVQQLDTERRNSANELLQANHRIAYTKFYLEKKELEKRVADLEARKPVLGGDLAKARKLLLALQTRHEELGGRSDSSSRTMSLGATSSSTRGTFCNDSTASLSSSWKHEGYGNIGRGPGSSRRSRVRDTRSTATTSSQRQSSSSSTPSPPRQESPFAPPPRGQRSTARPQSSTTTTTTTTTTKETYSNGSTASFSSASSAEDAWIHDEFGSVYTGRSRGRDTRPTASSSQRKSSSPSTSPPTRQESPVTPPPRRQTSTTRSQSSTTTTTAARGTSIDGGMASSSIEEDAWKHEGYGNIMRGPGSSRRSRGRDTRSASSSQQQQNVESADPSPPPRHEKKHVKSKKREAKKATRNNPDPTWMEKLAGVFNSRP